MTQKQLNDALRKKYLDRFIEIFKMNNEDVLITGTNEFCFPTLDDEQNEKFVQVVVKIPKGSRDGEEFDGYALAEDFKLKQEQKKIEAKEKLEKKLKKIERDKKIREQKKNSKGE